MISVVIPLYNKENSIAGTVDSVLNQTYTNYEVIIVDDGSTDNSLQVAEAIKDERIRIVTKKNGGVSSARNAGIMLAKYDYIAFLDGDDIWLPWHLQTICNMINKYTDPTVGGYCTKIVKCKDVEQLPINNNYTEQITLIEDYLKEASGTDSILSSSSFAVKKLCFDEVGLFKEGLSYGEDVELWYRLFTKYKLAKSNVVTARYILSSENRSDKKIMPLAKRFHEFDFSNKSNTEKKYLGKLVCLIILDYAIQGAFTICLEVFWRYKRYSFYILSYFIKLLKKKDKRAINFFK
jgi:glycosyltransferase involved in cell wall biosynthesis